MISIDDIKNVTFRRASFGGYKPYEVDSFIDNIQISFSELHKENTELKGYIKELSNKLEKYQEEESCIRNAILSAQKLADASLLDADNKSKSMILDASKQANEIVCKAKEEAELERDASWKLHMQAEKFRSKLIKLYDDQVDAVKRSLDGIQEDEDEIGKIVLNKRDGAVSEEEGKCLDNSECSQQETPILEEELKKDISNIVEISSNDNIDSGLDYDDSEFDRGVKQEEGTSDGSKRKKLEDLKFGPNYSFSSHEFGKGLYSGLFRREK